VILTEELLHNIANDRGKRRQFIVIVVTVIDIINVIIVVIIIIIWGTGDVLCLPQCRQLALKCLRQHHKASS